MLHILFVSMCAKMKFLAAAEALRLTNHNSTMSIASCLKLPRDGSKIGSWCHLYADFMRWRSPGFQTIPKRLQCSLVPNKSTKFCLLPTISPEFTNDPNLSSLGHPTPKHHYHPHTGQLPRSKSQVGRAMLRPSLSQWWFHPGLRDELRTSWQSSVQ
jgi:hypothetical protein